MSEETSKVVLLEGRITPYTEKFFLHHDGNNQPQKTANILTYFRKSSDNGEQPLTPTDSEYSSFVD